MLHHISYHLCLRPRPLREPAVRQLVEFHLIDIQNLLDILREGGGRGGGEREREKEKRVRDNKTYTTCKFTRSPYRGSVF